MKRFLAVLTALVAITASAYAETFADLQQEVNRTAPVNYNTSKQHTFSGTIEAVDYVSGYFEIQVAVDDDGSSPFLPYWSDHAYFIARFAGLPEDCHYAVGDHVKITGTLQPRYSSVRVIWLDITAIDGNEEFWEVKP